MNIKSVVLHLRDAQGSHPCANTGATVTYHDGSVQYVPRCTTVSSGESPVCGGMTPEFDAAVTAYQAIRHGQAVTA